MQNVMNKGKTMFRAEKKYIEILCIFCSVFCKTKTAKK